MTTVPPSGDPCVLLVGSAHHRRFHAAFGDMEVDPVHQ